MMDIEAIRLRVIGVVLCMLVTWSLFHIYKHDKRSYCVVCEDTEALDVDTPAIAVDVSDERVSDVTAPLSDHGTIIFNDQDLEPTYKQIETNPEVMEYFEPISPVMSLTPDGVLIVHDIGRYKLHFGDTITAEKLEDIEPVKDEITEEEKEMSGVTWPKVFVSPESVRYDSTLRAEADLFCAKGLLLAGHKPPEKYGEGCVAITETIGKDRYLEIMRSPRRK